MNSNWIQFAYNHHLPSQQIVQYPFRKDRYVQLQSNGTASPKGRRGVQTRVLGPFCIRQIFSTTKETRGFSQDILSDSVPSTIPALKVTEVKTTISLTDKKQGTTSCPTMSTHSHSGGQTQHHAFTFRKGIWPQSCCSCQRALAAHRNKKKQNLLLGTRKWKLRNPTSMQFQQEPDAELPLQSLENPFSALKLNWESQIFRYCYYCLWFSILLVTSHIHRSKWINMYSCKYRQTQQ